MKAIHGLLQIDLGYIDDGPRESGPNGNKKIFLDKSATFMRALAKDLCFKEYKVSKNPAGIAVSGEVYLYGYWGNDSGLFFEINQPIQPMNGFLYRTTTGMKDHRGGRNLWLPMRIFADGDYEQLVEILMNLKDALAREIDLHFERLLRAA